MRIRETPFILLSFNTMETYYNAPIASYQAKITAARNDPAFLAKVRQAAADLETLGYAVVPDIVEPALLDWAHARFWEVMAAASNNNMVQPNGPADLRGFTFGEKWTMNKHGILEDSELAHLDFVHAVRLHPLVMLTFALLYGSEHSLVVATDRINYQLPREWLPRRVGFNDAWIATGGEPIQQKETDATWLHVDQAFTKPGRHCIQGLVVCVDADQPGDASTELVPGSHLRHAALEQELTLDLSADARKRDWYKFTESDKAKLAAAGFFNDFKTVHARKGSLILWDSRIAHQGGQIRADAQKLPRPNPRPRFIVYVCAQPAFTPLTPAQVVKKRSVFQKLKCTSHWPLQTTIFPPPRTWGKTVPVFKWTPHCVKPLDSPGTFPVMEELYGIASAFGKLSFCERNTAPLLPFAPESGMKKVEIKRPRSAAECDDDDAAKKKQRLLSAE